MAKTAKVTSPTKETSVKEASIAVKQTEKPVAKKTASKKKAEGGFMAALTPSAALVAVIGKKPLPRTEIIKAIWVYIKKNNLQANENKRMINADSKLKPLFEKDQTHPSGSYLPTIRIFRQMYWTLEQAGYMEDAPWPATKDELIDYAIRSGTPVEVIENLQELDELEMYESMEDVWPDYPTKDDFMFNEDEY
eukprot:gene9215-12454_t